MKGHMREFMREIEARQLNTAHGTIPFPAFFPVTTFGEKYALDQLVRPFLSRMSPCLMVSYYYAQQMKRRPDYPLFVDSGGFASLFEGAEIIEKEDHASIRSKDGNEISPLYVLRFQERYADIGATLDFIIPPGMDAEECQRRQRLTIQNALFVQQYCQSKSLTLYASLQCWDQASAHFAAETYDKAGFKGIAIGGFVPRAKDPDYMKSIVRTVREAAPNCLLHVFGCGNPSTMRILIEAGADSFDSSSYVRSVLDGKKQSHTPGVGIHADIYASLANLHQINCSISQKNEAPEDAIPNYAFVMRYIKTMQNGGK